MALVEIAKYDPRLVQVSELVTSSWEYVFSKKFGKEIVVPEFPDPAGIQEKAERGYKAIYLPKEYSGANAIPFIGKALGLGGLRGYCLSEDFENTIEHSGWRYVQGHPDAPLLGIGEEKTTKAIKKEKGEGITFNEELFLYLFLNGCVDRRSWAHIPSTKINSRDFFVSFSESGIATGKGWKKDGSPYIGTRWSVPV